MTDPLTIEEVTDLLGGADRIARRIGVPVNLWAKACHAISIAVVKSGLLPTARVARGGLVPGVSPHQHSWVVVGDDCYDPEAVIVDCTLWSYVPGVEKVVVDLAQDRPHEPHGFGSIWDHGRPKPRTGDAVPLAVEVSGMAAGFVRLASDGRGLDRAGWSILANAPVGDWPAGEIIGAMARTPDLSALVPIDRLGMLTDVNPGGLYLATPEIDLDRQEV